MKIGQGKVVAFDYVLTDDQGEVIDRGSGDDAMVYLHGAEQIFPALERALDGKDIGDKLKVSLAPKEAYGERQDQEEIRVPRGELPEELPLEPGAELVASDDDGKAETYWVVAVEQGWVVLTQDHPLSGLTLHFDVTITEVRAATPEEVEHGHAHGGRDDDHHHHHH